MKKIEKFEEAIQNECSNLRKVGINPIVFHAYRHSCEANNVLIDFDECISNADIPDVIRELKKNHISAFTISSGFSHLIDVLAEFEKCGCSIFGLTTVKTPYKDLITDEIETKNAIEMSID